MEVTDDHQFIRKNVESIESDPFGFVGLDPFGLCGLLVYDPFGLESIESDPFGFRLFTDSIVNAPALMCPCLSPVRLKYPGLDILFSLTFLVLNY